MANFGGPFTYNLLGEILLIVNLASLSLPIVLRAGVISFFSAAYRLILYSSTQQGLRVNGRFSITAVTAREILIMFSHIWPLLLLLMSPMLI